MVCKMTTSITHQSDVIIPTDYTTANFDLGAQLVWQAFNPWKSKYNGYLANMSYAGTF